MYQYNVFEAIYLSFFSKKLYRDVASTWGGKAFLYALMITAISWTISVYGIQQKISAWYAHSSGALVEQLPIITIKGGKVSTPENKPYIVVEPSTKETLVVVDTSGKYTTLAASGADYLVTESTIITKDGDVTKVIQVPASLNTTIIPLVINEHIKGWVGYLWVFLLPLLTLVSFLFMVLKSLFYGIIGRIFSALSGAGLGLFQCMSLYLVAVTPSFVLWNLFYNFNIVFPHRGLTLFTLVLVYLFYAILMNKPKKEA